MSESKDDNISTLVSANGLNFQPIPQISVVTQRSIVKYPAMRDSYNAGQTVLVDVPTGDSWVSPKTSWIRFKLQTTNASGTTSLYKGGSSMSCMEEILFKHSSGKEIFRNPRHNVHARINNLWSHSQDWINTVGSAAGYGTSEDTDTERTYCVPLYLLSDLFNTNQLLPPKLISGSQLSIRLASVVEAFFSTTSAATAYTFSDCNLYLDSITLSDAVNRKMLQEITMGNVELEFSSFLNYENQSGAASTTYVIDSQAAVSRATTMVGCSRVAANLTDAEEDSLAPDVSDMNYLRSRLGALTFPDEPLVEPKDLYTYSLRTMQRLNNGRTSSVTYDDWLGDATQVPSTATVSNSELISCYMQKSDFLLGSGLPTSKASGSLIVDVRFATSKSRIIDIFINYQRSVKVGQKNIVVKE